MSQADYERHAAALDAAFAGYQANGGDVREAQAAAEALGLAPPRPASATPSAAPSVRRMFEPLAGELGEPQPQFDVTMIRGDAIKPEAIVWYWYGWLAAGKIHVFGGAPGTGKTTIAMVLAAILSRGGYWPDGTRCEAGNVAIWSGEDDPADTLVPRLVQAGADMKRVFFVGEVQDGTSKRTFDPARDMEPLRRALESTGNVKLLIVDPIVSAVQGDSHKNAEVRRSLQPLADLAAHLGCAVLGITHFSKGTGGRDPVERLTGSLAFGALARVVLVAAKQESGGENDAPAPRLFCRAKSNIGSDAGGFEYELVQTELARYPGVSTSAVVWGKPLEGSARELLRDADASGDDEGGSLADAKQFLASLLSDGPLPSKTVKADADGAGYAWRTIQRAQKALGIEAVKEGMRGRWVWRLPAYAPAPTSYERPKSAKESEDCQQKLLAAFDKFGALRNDSDEGEVF